MNCPHGSPHFSFCSACCADIEKKAKQERHAKTIATLRDALECCNGWEPDACLFGNVTAGELGEALAESIGVMSGSLWDKINDPTNLEETDWD